MSRRVALVLLTYARTKYAVKTLESFLDNVRYKGDLHVHIADDGSPLTHVQALWETAIASTRAHHISISNAERGGYGRSVNLATQTVHRVADYVFMLEDDWELFRPGVLDLDELIDDMEAAPQIECIRLGYLSWTQELRGTFINAAQNRKYVLLDPNSPEPHVFAGHPRLERVSYQRRVGAWPEGLAPGATEFVVAQTAAYRAARIGVAWPVGLDARQDYGVFAHIGSVQSTATLPAEVGSVHV